MSEKEKKQKKSPVKLKKDMSIIYIVMALLMVLAEVGVAYTMFSLTSFSGLSKTLFIVVNIVILLLMLIVNVLFMITVRTKSRNLFITVCVILAMLVGIGGYGAYAAHKVNVNMDKIVVKEEVTETIETSVVTLTQYDFDSVSDLDGKVIGFVTGSNNADIGKSHIDADTTSVVYKDYEDLNTLFMELIGGSVDAAIMPSNYKGIFGVVDDYEEALELTESLDTFEEQIKVQVEKSDKDITAEPFSVLVLGVDESRSDANMLVTFNPISMEITMTSIARDSYVPICGRSSDKLGHARVQGVQCTINTIENLLDVDIDYYFESNFQGIIDIVNALGGITVNNPYEFVAQNASDQRGHYTVWIPAGEGVALNGEQALGFARERHLYASGDFQRQANQQQVVTAILTKAMRTRNLNTLLNVLDAAGENIKTNLSVDQLTALFNFVMRKAGRYYGADEHIEHVFKIVGSRVTGYNSSVWSEAAQLALSIVRPYEGSIRDNHDAITRNLNLKSKITAPKSFKWDATWEFYAPTVSNETYAEKVIQSETPDSYFCNKTGGSWDGNACACPFGNFVSGQGCAEVETASSYTDMAACTFAGYKWNEATGSCVESCPSGTEADTTGVCKMSGESEETGDKFKLTINYVDDQGNAIRMADVYEYAEGESYDITAPQIEGYTIEAPRTAGTMPAGDTSVTFRYKKSGESSEHVHDKNGRQETVTEATCDAAATVKYYCSADDGYFEILPYGEKKNCEVTHTHDTNGTAETLQYPTCDLPSITRYYCSAGDGYYTDVTGGTDPSQCQVTPEPEPEPEPQPDPTETGSLGNKFRNLLTLFKR